VLSEQWANENDSNISKMEKMERQVQRKIQEQYLAIELEKKVKHIFPKITLCCCLNPKGIASKVDGIQIIFQNPVL